MEYRLIGLLVTPSTTSLITVALMTVAIIGWENWTFLTYNSGLYDFFYGGHGIITIFEQSPDALSAVDNALSSGSLLLYGAALAAVALAVGLCVFFVLHLMHHGLQLVRQRSANTAAIRHERWQRFATRTIALLLWLIYAFFTVVVALPYCLLLARVGADDIITVHGLTLAALAALLLAIALHVHIIFARLFFMRPRVFGGEIEVEDSLL